MTLSSDDEAELIAGLKGAVDGHDDSKTDWIEELPPLPDLPTSDEHVAIVIPKRAKGGDDSGD